MQKRVSLTVNARKRLDAVQHMLGTTYTIIDEPKILIPLLVDIQYALLDIVKQLLNIDPNKDIGFQKLMSLFIVFANQHKIDKHEFDFIYHIQSLLDKHASSPIEFAKNKDFVICAEDYTYEKINSPIIKKYLSSSRNFIKLVELKIQNE